jgi:hypothetical protein
MKAGKDFLNFEVEKMTSFNQVLVVDVLVCSEEKVWSILVVQASERLQATHGEVVWKDEKEGIFECEEKRWVVERVRFRKYFIHFGIAADSVTRIKIGFENPEFVNFFIVVRGFVFIVCFFSCYLAFRFSFVQLRRGKGVLMLSFSCLIYAFPYKLGSVMWNFEIWRYFEVISRGGFLFVFFSFIKPEKPLSVRRNILFYITVVIFTSLNILSRAYLPITLFFFILLSLFLYSFYLERLKRIKNLSPESKIDLLVELFMVVFITLGVQSGLFSELRHYPSLETLSFLLIITFLLYIQWSIKFFENFLPKTLNSCESEMISIPPSLQVSF